MNITFVFDGLQFGGIERVGVEYIKLLMEKGHNISVLNLRPNLTDMEKELPSEMKIQHILFPRSITPQRYSKLVRYGLFGQIVFYVCRVFMGIIQIIYKPLYYKKLPKPDIAIAFSGHYNDLTFVSQNFGNAKKIAWIHGNQASYDEAAPGYFRLYKEIKNLVCLSEKDDDCVISFNQKNNIRKKLIYNPINLKERAINRELVDELKQQYADYILMVGRMAKDKDQSTLIQALQYLKNKYGLSKNLILVGDGPERTQLEKMVCDKHLEAQVHFMGARYDVQNYYAAATVYAHSSPAEGLPTVLLEAMYYELPIASTNSEPGVQEILQDNCGLITPVGDAQALADSLYKLYTDEKLVAKIKTNGQARIKDFLSDHVIEKFEQFIQNVE